MAAPVIEAADISTTVHGSGANPWVLNHQTVASGTLIVWVGAWDDSVTTTDVAAPTGQNGETINVLVGPQASASTEMRMKAFWTVTTAGWTAGTLNFTPTAAETCRWYTIHVAPGEFDASNPIGAFSSSASAGTAETNANSPAFNAAVDDGGGRLVISWGSDGTVALTGPGSGVTQLANGTTGAVGHLLMTRDTETSNSESIASLTATLASADSWASLAFIIRGPATGGGTTRGRPFGNRGTAFNGGRTFGGMLSREAITTRGFAWPRLPSLLR